MDFLRDPFWQFIITGVTGILGILLSFLGVIPSIRSFNLPAGEKQAKDTSTIAIHTPSLVGPRLSQKFAALRVQASKTGTYIAGLIATASPMPMVAVLIGAILYVAPLHVPRPGLLAAPGGTVLTLIIWLLIAIPYRRLTSVDRANPSTYENFLQRLYQAEARLATALYKKWFKHPTQPFNMRLLSMDRSGKWTNSARPILLSDEKPALENYEVREVRASLDTVYSLLQKPSRSWMTGTGYINISGLLHRIDEILIDAETTEQVVARAVEAKIRIEGSEIGIREELVNQAKAAASALIESKRRQLPDLVPVGEQRGTSVPDAESIERQARITIREISASLHHYQDALWEGLVRARIRLMTMVFIIGCLLYVLLQIALLLEVQALVLVEVAVLYFVGALVGLFSSLYTFSTSPWFGNSSIHGLSLTVARLLMAPLLSGFAAIGGVLVVLSITLLIQGGSLAHANLLPYHPYTLLVAAIFGLSPNLLQNALQKRIGQLQASLKRIETPGEGKED